MLWSYAETMQKSSGWQAWDNIWTNQQGLAAQYNMRNLLPYVINN